MNGYLPSIEAMEEPMLMTLTHRTVSGSHLRATQAQDIKIFNNCKRSVERKGLKVVGLRKVEVEVEQDGKFHTHLHVLIDGEVEAYAFVKQWLKKHPLYTNEKAQDVRPMTDPHELFKYFTKMVTKGKEMDFNPVAMDKVFTVMKGKRVVQPFGGFTKAVEEDIDPDKGTELDWRPSKPDDMEIWVHEEAGEHTDYYNAYGEPLAQVDGRIMDKETLNFISNISNGSQEQSR